ncbi:MAG: M28 family peptidase [Prolixibacteraceae bacterium]|nr:M28 family peptidase [Prolixibacteraceae bacterium]
MKRFILFLFFCLGAIGGFSQKTDSEIESIIEQINIESYRVHFDSLKTGPKNNRKVIKGNQQTNDHNNCRDYIFRCFKNFLGPNNAYLHHFEMNDFGGLCNVVGIKKGQNKYAGIWIVSAHYDSNNINDPNINSQTPSPGANDNGTGLAAILEIARIVSTIETDATIIFAAWDLEEIFFDGFAAGSNSWYEQFVTNKTDTQWEQLSNKGKIASTNIKGNINFDMFGNPQLLIEGKPVLWNCYANKAHKDFCDDISQTMNSYTPELISVSHGPMHYSDHYTFAARQLPAVLLLESNYTDDKFYHTADDNTETPENIDYSFATTVTKGGLAYILQKTMKRKSKNEITISPCVRYIEHPSSYQLISKNKNIIEIYNTLGASVDLNNFDKKNTSFSPKSEGLYFVRIIQTDSIFQSSVLLKKKEQLSFSSSCPFGIF